SQEPLIACQCNRIDNDIEVNKENGPEHPYGRGISDFPCFKNIERFLQAHHRSTDKKCRGIARVGKEYIAHRIYQRDSEDPDFPASCLLNIEVVSIWNAVVNRRVFGQPGDAVSGYAEKQRSF